MMAAFSFLGSGTISITIWDSIQRKSPLSVHFSINAVSLSHKGATLISILKYMLRRITVIYKRKTKNNMKNLPKKFKMIKLWIPCRMNKLLSLKFKENLGFSFFKESLIKSYMTFKILSSKIKLNNNQFNLSQKSLLSKLNKLLWIRCSKIIWGSKCLKVFHY